MENQSQQGCSSRNEERGPLEIRDECAAIALPARGNLSFRSPSCSATGADWGAFLLIQALDVDRAEPRANGPDRQEDRALPV